MEKNAQLASGSDSRPLSLQNPFDTRSSVPDASRTTSIMAAPVDIAPGKVKRKFKSTRLIGEYEKPWLVDRDPRMKYDRIIFWAFGLLAAGGAAYLVYTGWASFIPQKYCLSFEDDFSAGINYDHWSHEIQTGGFGAGSFEWTTDDKRNVYTDAEGLHIVPTLTIDTTSITAAQLVNGYKLNLTRDGTCTSHNRTQCYAASNKTTGAIINPVRSARLSTKGKQALTYGKVEFVAKLPKGDWLWPAVWMMPENSRYGEWPMSGEIDIMEGKGNDPKSSIGRNIVSSALHWGPNTPLDMFAKTFGSSKLDRGDYSEEFHTFGMEWSPNYIFMYVDFVLRQTMYVPFGSRWGDMYSRGKYGAMDYQGNGPPANPWSISSNNNAPFDSDFYLIINVAVGGTSGYFPDGVDAKPWADRTNTTMKDFWDARNAWEPTWGEGDTRGLTVQKLSMWKVC